MILILLAAAVGLILVLLAIGKVPLSYTIRNLTLRWRTTLLTALAFTAVVALLTVMLAFVNGMRRLTEGTGQPGNVLILADGATDESFSNLSIGDLAEIENLPEVLRENGNGRPLASRETYLVVNQPIPNASPGYPKRRFLQLRGIDDPVLAVRVHRLELLPGGTWFSEAGVQEIAGTAPEEVRGRPAVQAVLGEGVARELARDRTPQQLAAARNPQRLDLGDTFILGNRPWIVVGIMRSGGSTFNSEIWAKQSLIGPLFGKQNLTTLVVRTRDAETARQFKEFLGDKNRYKKSAVAPQVETDYYSSLSETNEQFLFAIVVVTIVISIGGIFGVMNTMFAAISQRLQDIGVLRLLGYARRQILVAFLVEALAIALVGGLLGCALGWMADGWSATSVVSSHQGGGKFVMLTLAVDGDILAVGLLVSLVMGGLGGVLPALSAMRLRPLEALR